MRAEGIAGMSTCPRANAAWPIIPTFHRIADGYSLLRWTAEVKFFPAGSFHSRARTTGEIVGPPNGACLSGAWSPDGKWIYLTAKTDDFHIWRQRFPDGDPEQFTFGPTSQEGLAMAPDGKSVITSVGSEDLTVWLHDKDGDHQISSEGNTSLPGFSADGRSLYFLKANTDQTRSDELWVKELDSGKDGEGFNGLSDSGVFRWARLKTGIRRIARRERSCIRHEGSGRPYKPVDCSNQPSLVAGAHLLYGGRRFSLFSCPTAT